MSEDEDEIEEHVPRRPGTFRFVSIEDSDDSDAIVADSNVANQTEGIVL